MKNSKPLIPFNNLTEAAAVYRITPTRVFAYKKKTTNPNEVQTVQIRHAEIHKHYNDLIDPGPAYKVIGYIGPNWGKTTDDVEGAKGKAITVEPDSEAVQAKEKDSPLGLKPGDLLQGKKGGAPAPEPKAAEPEPKTEPASQEPPAKVEPEPKKKPDDSITDLPGDGKKTSIEIDPAMGQVALNLGYSDSGQVAKLLSALDILNPEAPFKHKNLLQFLIKHVGISDASNQKWIIADLQAAGILKNVSKEGEEPLWKWMGVPKASDLEPKQEPKAEPEPVKAAEPAKEPELQPEPAAQKEPEKEPEIPPAPPPPAPAPEETPIDGDVADIAKTLGFLSDGTIAKVLQKIKAAGDEGLSIEEVGELMKSFASPKAVKDPKFGPKSELAIDKLKDSDFVSAVTDDKGQLNLVYKGIIKPPSDLAIKIAKDIDGENKHLPAAIEALLQLSEKGHLTKIKALQTMSKIFGGGGSLPSMTWMWLGEEGYINPFIDGPVKMSPHPVEWIQQVFNLTNKLGHSKAPDVAKAIYSMMQDPPGNLSQVKDRFYSIGLTKQEASEAANLLFATSIWKTNENGPAFDLDTQNHPFAFYLGDSTSSIFDSYAEKAAYEGGPDKDLISNFLQSAWVLAGDDSLTSQSMNSLAQIYNIDNESAALLWQSLQGKEALKVNDKGSFSFDLTKIAPVQAVAKAQEPPTFVPEKLPEPETAAPPPEGPSGVGPETPSKVTVFPANKLGPFHPEDFAIWDNHIVISKFFKSNYNLGLAKKKEKELKNYFATKYGSDWEKKWKHIDSEFKNNLSKHQYYEVQSKGALKQLMKAYGDDWFLHHPTTQAAWGIEPEKAKPTVSTEPSPDEAKIDDLFPENILDGVDVEDLLLYANEGSLFHLLANKYGNAQASDLIASLTKHLEDTYGDLNKKYHQVANKYSETFGTVALSNIFPKGFELLKNKYGDDLLSKQPSLVTAVALLKAKEPEPAVPVNATTQTAPTKITTLTQADTGIFHPEDFVIAIRLSNIRSEWQKEYGFQQSMDMLKKVQAELLKAYGPDWSHQRDEVLGHLSSKFGPDTLVSKIDTAISELSSGYGDKWNIKHPLLKKAFDGMFGTDLPGITPEDIIPGKPSALSGLPQNLAGEFHPEDLFLLLNRHNLHTAWTVAHGYDAAESMYDKLLTYMKHKYGGDIIDKANAKETSIKQAKGNKYEDFLADSKKELAAAYKSDPSHWYQNHPSLQAAMAGDTPPIQLGPTPAGANIPLDHFKPGGSSVVKAFSAEEMGGFHPEDFLLLRKKNHILNNWQETLGDKEAQEEYDKFLSYFEKKYGADFMSKYNTVINGLVSQGNFHKKIVEANKEISKAYGVNPDDWFLSHPITKAIKSGASPSPVHEPTDYAKVPEEATPSKFTFYNDSETAPFAPEDYALLTNLHFVWSKLEKKLGPEKANDAYVKLSHYFHDKYGTDFTSKIDILKKSLISPSSNQAVLQALKKSYGDDWVDAHPSVLAALSGKSGKASAADLKAMDQAASLQEPEAQPFKGVIPKVTDLKLKGSGKHLGGEHDKKIYTDPSGQDWLYKPAIAGSGNAKSFSAYGAQGFSVIAKMINPNHIPIAKVDIKGETGTIQPMLELADTPTLAKAPPASLKPSEKSDVANEHVLDWLFSQHDSHGANLLRTKQGHIIGVDKDQVFRYIDSDELSTSYAPNAPYIPYYNTFWNDWAAGKFEFNPESMAGVFEKLDSISDEDFTAAIKPYAETFYKGNPDDQIVFIQKIKNRKNTIKRKFEKFITNLYNKKTGSNGKFTFAGGWDTGVPTKKIVKYAAKDLLSKAGGKVSEFKGASVDPTKVTLKMPVSQSAKLKAFLKEVNLTAEGDIKLGNQYCMAFVKKAELDAAHISKEEIEESSLKKVPPTPPVPKYKPSVELHKPQKPNAAEINQIPEVKLGHNGKHFNIGGAAVEGQCVRVKKFTTPSGKSYYTFTMKLRPQFWNKIAPGTNSKLSFNIAKFDPSKDTFDEASETSYSTKSEKWAVGDATAHLVRDEGNSQYTYKGVVVARIPVKEGESPKQGFKNLLNAMHPGLAEDVLRDPTPEEQETMKLARLLWATAPQTADKLQEGDYTPQKLRTLLKAAGVSENTMSRVETREVLPGHVSHVLPGRWKDLAKTSSGKPALRYFWTGVSNPARVVNILKYGALGIFERNLSGIDGSAASFSQDIMEGGGDNIYTRASMASSAHNTHEQGVCGDINLIYPPDEADRLDTYGHPSDSYGASNPHNGHSSAWIHRKPLNKLFQNLQDNYQHGNEINFRKGIAASRILRVACNSESVRQTLIAKLKEEGVNEVNDVPVEDFVVHCESQGETYEKYVKPLGY